MIGKKLAHYEIVEKLGRGGMGEVFVAEDTKLGRQVALKVLPPELAGDSERLARFEQEARAVASLNHPNIVTLHSIEEADGAHFLTMELVRGKTLTALIPKDGFALGELLDLAVPIAEAVSAAHQQGITHRDLKPDNVVVTADGVPKVLDFGLAKLAVLIPGDDSGSRFPTVAHTAEGHILGTVSYMSPEQAEGKPVDRRSDVFSLGIVFYEMATGRRPFEGDTGASILASILKETPKPVTEWKRALPRHLGRILRICLAKDPLRRYQSAIDLRNELEELRAEARSGDLFAPEGGAVATSRRSRLGPLAFAGTLAALVVAVAALWYLRPVEGGKAPAGSSVRGAFTQVTELSGQEMFPTISPDGKYVAYTSDARGNQDIYWQRIGGRNPINLTEGSAVDDSQPAYSPDGEWIAFRSDRDGGGIYVMGATGESVRRLTDLGQHPAWSPDGATIVFSTSGTADPSGRTAVSGLWTVEVATGEVSRLHEQDAVQPAWSPGGHRIAFWGIQESSGQRDLWTIPAGGGESIPVTEDIHLDWSPVWSPAGDHLYFASDRSGSMNLWRVPIDERTGRTLGEPEPVTTGVGSANEMITISADGRRIAYAARASGSEVLAASFDPGAGVLLGPPEPVGVGSKSMVSAQPSPDGDWLVFANFGSRQEDIFVSRADGSDIRQLTDDRAKDRVPRWSPSGDRIAFYSDRSGSYEIWTVRPDGSDLRRLTDKPELSLLWQIWSPDGSRILCQDIMENEAYLVRTDVDWTEQEMELVDGLRTDGEFFRSWSWSPDGTHLAGTLRGGIATYSFASGEIRRLADRGGFPVWLPDSRHIVFPEGSALYLLDTRTGVESELLNLHPAIIPGGAANFSTDGRTLYLTPLMIESDIWMLELD